MNIIKELEKEHENIYDLITQIEEIGWEIHRQARTAHRELPYIGGMDTLETLQQKVTTSHKVLLNLKSNLEPVVIRIQKQIGLVESEKR